MEPELGLDRLFLLLGKLPIILQQIGRSIPLKDLKKVLLCGQSLRSQLGPKRLALTGQWLDRFIRAKKKARQKGSISTARLSGPYKPPLCLLTRNLS